MNPIQVLYLSLPFLAVVVMAISVTKRVGVMRGGMFLLFFQAITAAIYVHGVIVYQARLAEHSWTAAAVALGALPIKSIPIVIGAWLLKAWLLASSRATPEIGKMKMVDHP